MQTVKLIRSALFVPGSRVEILPKADLAKPDVVILDLEDSVPAHGKENARTAVAATLRNRADRLTFLRINHPAAGWLAQDVATLGPHASQVVTLPKVDRIDDVRAVDQALSEFEAANGLAANSIGLVISIESARGLRILHDALCSSPRACGAALATAEEGDLLADLGGRWTPSGEALAYCRGKFVCDARAAGALWLLDGAFMALTDEAALSRESRLARTYGFTGKIAIHPCQVSTINAAYSPDAEEIARARRLLAAFEDAQAKGLGAINFEGMMVDYANVRLAQQVLIIADGSAV